MAEDVKFAFVATGTDDKSPNIFTHLLSKHITLLRARLDRDKKKPSSFITLPARVRIVHFSFKTDEILVKDEFFGQASPNPKQGFVPIGSVTDGLSSFLTKSSPMSIIDVYHAVRRAPRQSVIDVSLYSHGFVEGPVFINTGDGAEGQQYSPGNPKRDPNDRDGRVRTDFFPNMGENPATADGKDALSQFKGGFVTGGAFRVFGCNVQDVVKFEGDRLYLRSIAFETLHQAYITPLTITGATRKSLLRGENPVQPIVLDMGHEFDVEISLKKDPHISHELNGVPLTSAKLLEIHYSDDLLFQGETARKLSKAYSEIVQFAARRVSKSYVFAAAQALTPEVIVFGALPGCGGLFDPGGTMFLDRHVCGPYLHFYEKFVKIKTVEDGAVRQANYGVFDAQAVANVKSFL